MLSLMPIFDEHGEFQSISVSYSEKVDCSSGDLAGTLAFHCDAEKNDIIDTKIYLKGIEDLGNTLLAFTTIDKDIIIRMIAKTLLIAGK